MAALGVRLGWPRAPVVEVKAKKEGPRAAADREPARDEVLGGGRPQHDAAQFVLPPPNLSNRSESGVLAQLGQAEPGPNPAVGLAAPPTWHTMPVSRRKWYGARAAAPKGLAVAVSDFVLYEEEFKQLEEALQRLRQDSNSRAVFLIDKNGQQLAAAGETENFDTTSLASLTAGNVAATDGLAKLIGEREFSVLFHEGQQDHIHISIVAKRAILVVIFDDRSSLGLVRLRVKRASVELERIFEVMAGRHEHDKTKASASVSPFSEITDEDIDALFSE